MSTNEVDDSEFISLLDCYMRRLDVKVKNLTKFYSDKKAYAQKRTKNLLYTVPLSVSDRQFLDACSHSIKIEIMKVQDELQKDSN